MPYGTETSVGYWYAAKWESNNCHTNRVWDPCSQHDWAILLLRDNAYSGSPNGHPGAMGYWVYGKNYIAANAVSHDDGYPMCGFAASPAGCAATPDEIWGADFGLYGDWVHVASRQRSPPIIALHAISAAATAARQIGPTIRDRTAPYVIGIAMWEHCFDGPADCDAPCTAADTHPSGFRGMTLYLANFITNLRVPTPRPSAPLRAGQRRDREVLRKVTAEPVKCSNHIVV